MPGCNHVAESLYLWGEMHSSRRSGLIADCLNNLEEIAPRIGEESESTPDLGYIAWFADDGHAAELQLGDGVVDAVDANASEIGVSAREPEKAAHLQERGIPVRRGDFARAVPIET
jgi:hypothetical protein